MREWFTAAEIAELGLTGLPTSKMRVLDRAKRDGWQSRPRAGRGGGYEYHRDSLPQDARLELTRRLVDGSGAAFVGKVLLQEEIESRAELASRKAGLAQFAALNPGLQSRAEARAAIVTASDSFIRASGLPAKRGREVFATDYNAGKIDVETWVRTAIPRVCGNSIDNWKKQLQREGLARLAGKYGQHRKGSGKIDSNTELKNCILGMLVDHPHVSAKLVMRGVRARFDAKVLPSYRSLQRWIETWKAQNQQLHTAITNPDKWRSRYQAAGGDADAAIVRLNQRWEFDGTKADLLLSDNTRHVIIGVIDVYSRRLKLHVSRSNSAAAVASLTRRALLDWGVPEIAGTDNGSDYVSRHMKRVFAGLGIEHDIAPPFTPEHKPFIERAFRTFSHDLVELLAGFIGHNVAERQDIEARRSFADRLMKTGGGLVEIRLSPEELQSFCDQWTDNIYGIEPHSGIGGKSPFELATSWTQAIARIDDERALDVLLAEAPGDSGFRVVGKKGIRLDRAHFEHPHLGGHEGERVRVLLDEADIGEIYVFAEEGAFICKAVCPERAGISRQDLAAARKAHQKKAIAEERKVLKAIAREANTQTIVRDILVERATAAGKLAAFPPRSVSHETEALAEAARAARFGTIESAPLTPAQEKRKRQLEAELAAERAEPAEVVQLDTPTTRFKRALGIEKRIAAGGAVDAEDLRWFEIYRTQPEYRARKSVAEEFGEDIALGA